MFEFCEQESKIHISNFKEKKASGLFFPVQFKAWKHSKITFSMKTKFKKC